MRLDININFNNGEFYTDGSQWAAIAIAIFSVVITVIVQRFYDSFKNNEHLDNLYDFIKSESVKLGQNAIWQADGLIGLCHTLKDSKVGDYDTPKVSSFDTDMVADWTSMDFYHSIINRRSCKDSTLLINEYRNIKVAFKQAKELEKSIGVAYEQLNQKYIRTQDEWKEHVQMIPELLNYYKIERNVNRVPVDDFLTRFSNVISYWSSLKVENHNEMSFVFENIVKPLMVVCSDYQLEPRSYRLMSELLHLKGAYKEMQHIKYRYRRWFTKTARKHSPLMLLRNTTLKVEYNFRVAFPLGWRPRQPLKSYLDKT